MITPNSKNFNIYLRMKATRYQKSAAENNLSNAIKEGMLEEI